MSAIASCKFPFLEEWKRLTNQNKALEVIDSVLSGYAQIAFNDNSFSGLLLIVAIYIGSPVQAISGVWATLVATIIAYIFRIPNGLIRAGLYGFNAALAGLAIPVLIFPNSSITLELLLYSALAAIFTVLLTAALGQMFLKWDIPTLALPYSITLFIFIPASVILRGLNASPPVAAIIEMAGAHTQNIWTIGEFLTATVNGISQVIWVDNILSGILYLIAVIIASRIDTISTIIGALVSTLVAIALGLPKESVIIGLYGYNAVLLMKVITRGFVINNRSYILAIILAAFTTIVTASLNVVFAPLGVTSVAAFPYSILCIIVFMTRDLFKNLIYVPAKNWGVPETIYQESKLNYPKKYNIT